MIYTNDTIAAKYEYDPYGNVLSQIGPLANANLYRFSSQEYDAPSGLIIYLRRFYDPNLQRWINRDPISEQGGNNLYQFVGNEPISGADELGLLDYYYSSGSLLQPAGVVPYLEGETWYGNLGAGVYNVIPLLANLVTRPFSQIGCPEGTAVGNGDNALQVALSGVQDAVTVATILGPPSRRLI